MRTRLSWLPVFLSLTLVAGTCPDEPTKPRVATQLGVAVAPSPTAPNRVVFPVQPVIQLEDADGNPFADAGVPVTAAISGGGGTLNGTTTNVTDASGKASFTNLTIAGTAAARVLSFSSGGLRVATAQITITAGAATTMASSAGNAQAAVVGNAVGVAPAVLVTDADANPVPGVTVTFAAASGGGSVVGGSAMSDASGIATVGSWMLGAVAGTNALTATASGLTGSPVTFTANGTAGPAATLTNDAGDLQSATVGTSVSVLPSVKLVDANGNAVSGVSVTFVVGSGGGTITGGSQTTTAAGTAAVGSWTLGPIVGANSLTASVSGVTGPVTFTATGTVGAPATLAKVAGDGQSASVGAAVTVAPSVKLADANGNAVSGGTVTFAVASGGGSITGGSQTTNASGIATVGSWTQGSSAGANTLTASSTGVTAVTFGATATGVTPTIVRFCSSANMPLWFAYQNGPSGTWTQLASNGDSTYSVPITSTVAISFVMQEGSQFHQELMYFAKAEVQGSTACFGDGSSNGSKTVNGSVTGVSAAQIASINLGHITTEVTGSTTYSLTNIANGANDLVAGRGPVTTFGYLPNRYIVRRTLNPADGSTLPVLDFNAAEALAPATAIYTVSGVGTENWSVMTELWTATNTSTMLGQFNGSGTGGDIAVIYRGLPAAQRLPSDESRVSVSAGTASGGGERGFERNFTLPVDGTVTLGPSLTTPAVTPVTDAPVHRMRMQLQSQPAYSAYVVLNLRRSSNYGDGNSTGVFATAGYFGGAPTTWDITMPDLLPAGFNPAWGLETINDDPFWHITAGSYVPFFDSADETVSLFASRQHNPTGPWIGAAPSAQGTPPVPRLPFRVKK
jgi:hypothetical protein